ncbi:HAMP domain-containing histidine kinase [Candidatus Saccharibacteria bacterium]|nr:HAMP domain-containing histidine kinase [Candidatus Saccharibacteria bacterium]
MFRKTVINLTWQYSILLIGLVGLFSVSIYYYMNRTFASNYESNITSDLQHSDLEHSSIRQRDIHNTVDEGLDELQAGLLIADALVVLIIPIVSYQMARRALRPIQVSYETQQRFVDDASHELRTPLSIIQGELELALRRPRSPEHYQASIAASLTETKALSDLVASLLLLARGKADQVTAQFQPLNVYQLMTRSVRATRTAAPDVASRIHLNTPTNLTVMGSSALLEQAIKNLIDNAVKYSAVDTPITVAATSHNADIIITVTDQGIGMTDEEIRATSRRFWRAEAARNSPGHGLGLALVRQIIKLHNGRIDIKSTVGKGTTVTLVVPQANPHHS